MVLLCLWALLAYVASARNEHNLDLSPNSGRRLADTVDSSTGFLSQLPLQVVAVTPSVLLSPSLDPVPIQDQETIQVVFSRAVIPLGSDGVDAVPFSVSLPGGDIDDASQLVRFRWVNSYIGRLDPVDTEWPGDLQLQLSWNRSLVSWDGAPLEGIERLLVRAPKA